MHQIGIDVRMSMHTGIGRYIRGMLAELKGDDRNWSYALIGTNGQAKHFADRPQFKFMRTSVPIYGLREQIELPRLARSCGLLHIPHYNAPLFWRKKLVVTIHDLIHFHFKHELSSSVARLYAQFLLPAIVRRADAIIAVSEHTKQDLIQTLGAQPEKITVIHHGVDPIFLRIEDECERQDQKREPYFLCVGLIKAHKNLGVLLDAFQNLKKKLSPPGLALYIVGKADRRQRIVQKWLAVIQQVPDIRIIDDVHDEELRRLYRNAIALVLPSLYEGFGFPLLEAMACRIPIVAAQTASIPEVLGGEAGLYFDPHSAGELEQKMEQVLMDRTLWNQLVQAGLRRLSDFSWKKAAQETQRVYESTLGANS